MNSKFILSVFLFILIFNLVSSEDYYGDLEIKIDKIGFTTIEGITNYQGLIVEDSEEFVSKENGFWLLNITTKEVFSEYVYKVTLPKKSSINYIKSKGKFRIEGNGDEFEIIGVADNEPFEIIIQYQVEKPQGIDWKLFFSLLVLLIIIISLELKFRKNIWKKRNSAARRTPKHGMPGQKNKLKTSSLKYDLSKLIDRQKKIMKYLIEKNKPVTQSKISKELNIPKASVSRNIVSLELKGFVEKENVGVSTIIRLKK
ncbi:HTH domain-containing protein [archaeon]|jgi:uncharacterized membrane protein|nr:HTH domain-containing protein [archaeon]